MTSSTRARPINIDASRLPQKRQPQQSLQRRSMPRTFSYMPTNLRYQQQQHIRDLYEFKVERSKGLPVVLSCVDSSSSNDTREVLNTTILFDYEISLRNPEEGTGELLFQDLPKWEFFLLYYVAEDIGIIGCPLIGRQNITTFSPTNSSVDVVKLSSFGTDVVDTRVASCEFLVGLAPGYICLPLQGIMTAEFIGYESDRAAVEEFLAHHVAKVVNNTDLFGIGINQTSFIGSRVIPSPAPIADAVTDENQSIDRDSSTVDVTVAVASTFSVAAVFVLLLMFFVFARRGSRKSSNSLTSAVAENDITSKQVPIGGADDDDESCENMRQPQHVSTNPTQSSIDSTSDKSDDAKCGSLDSANRLGREVIASTSASAPSIRTPYSLTNTRTVSTVVSTDDSEIYIEDDDTAKASNVKESDMKNVSKAPTTVMTDALPPKHPTGPSSKSLLVPLVGIAKPPKSQRRRKKKKKKKVATIVRSNSRENIKEMETITEVEEETSGDNDMYDGSDDDEDGSWCSTSDSDPGSRDPSPARSSRDPSPARSTGSGDKEIATTTADVETKSRWNSSANIGPSPDRTIGTDKPNQNKLAPAWI